MGAGGLGGAGGGAGGGGGGGGAFWCTIDAYPLHICFFRKIRDSASLFYWFDLLIVSDCERKCRFLVNFIIIIIISRREALG